VSEYTQNASFRGKNPKIFPRSLPIGERDTFSPNPTPSAPAKPRYLPPNENPGSASEKGWRGKGREEKEGRRRKGRLHLANRSPPLLHSHSACVVSIGIRGYKGYRFFWSGGTVPPLFRTHVKYLLSSAVNRGELRRLNCTQIVFFAPDPEGAQDAPHLLVGWRGDTRPICTIFSS